MLLLKGKGNMILAESHYLKSASKLEGEKTLNKYCILKCEIICIIAH